MTKTRMLLVLGAVVLIAAISLAVSGAFMRPRTAGATDSGTTDARIGSLETRMSAIEAQLTAIMQALGISGSSSAPPPPPPPPISVPMPTYNPYPTTTYQPPPVPPPLPGSGAGAYEAAYGTPYGGAGPSYAPVPSGVPRIDQDGGIFNAGWDTYFIGRGFGAYEKVIVTSGGYFVTTANTDAGGNFTATIRLPAIPGTYLYQFTGQMSGAFAQATVYAQ